MDNSSLHKIKRPITVSVGTLKIGGKQPLVLQSMANSDTLDIEKSAAQFRQIAEAGGKLVRFTTQGKREVAALAEIRKALGNEYDHIPLVADVHFTSEVAMEAAKICEKVRINPGNFTGKGKPGAEWNDELYHEGYEKIQKKLVTLIEICKLHHTALRIGVNHGSLSERIMSRFGDTPEGMVESAMEFLRICNMEKFDNVVVSLKSSNTVLMVKAVRLLVIKMQEENLYFPLHLGVTESGDGPEGRIRSAVGMAPLLLEGIGDTIRVSLTEPPAEEIPVAEKIRNAFPRPEELPYDPFSGLPWDPAGFAKIESKASDFGIGGECPVVVIGEAELEKEPKADFIAIPGENGWLLNGIEKSLSVSEYLENGSAGDLFRITPETKPEKIAGIDADVWILDTSGFKITIVKKWFISYRKSGGSAPIILKREYHDKEQESYMIRAAGELSLLLIDSLADGIWLSNPFFPATYNTWLSFQVLQASRNRITTTEFIACPSCGRTLFDIRSVLKEVKERTQHLKGLKIAVMGCIVNGPGEMADADYGYIGAGPGRVSIFRKKECIMKNVPEGAAVDELIRVIREYGDWIES